MMISPGSQQKSLRGRLLALSKRPENKLCADCPEKRPTWAALVQPATTTARTEPQHHSRKKKSTTNSEQPVMILVGLICYQCAGAHRSLGTHITRVKSTTMADWSEDEVFAAEKSGNRILNGIYEHGLVENPASDTTIKPVEGSHGATRERFLRSKYEQQTWYNAQQYDQHQTEMRKPEQDSRHRHKRKSLMSFLKTSSTSASINSKISRWGTRSVASSNTKNNQTTASSIDSRSVFKSFRKDSAQSVAPPSSVDLSTVPDVTVSTAGDASTLASSLSNIRPSYTATGVPKPSSSRLLNANTSGADRRESDSSFQAMKESWNFSPRKKSNHPRASTTVTSELEEIGVDTKEYKRVPLVTDSEDHEPGAVAPRSMSTLDLANGAATPATNDSLNHKSASEIGYHATGNPAEAGRRRRLKPSTSMPQTPKTPNPRMKMYSQKTSRGRSSSRAKENSKNQSSSSTLDDSHGTQLTVGTDDTGGGDIQTKVKKPVSLADLPRRRGNRGRSKAARSTDSIDLAIERSKSGSPRRMPKGNKSKVREVSRRSSISGPSSTSSRRKKRSSRSRSSSKRRERGSTSRNHETRRSRSSSKSGKSDSRRSKSSSRSSDPLSSSARNLREKSGRSHSTRNRSASQRRRVAACAQSDSLSSSRRRERSRSKSKDRHSRRSSRTHSRRHSSSGGKKPSHRRSRSRSSEQRRSRSKSSERNSRSRSREHKTRSRSKDENRLKNSKDTVGIEQQLTVLRNSKTADSGSRVSSHGESCLSLSLKSLFAGDTAPSLQDSDPGRQGSIELDADGDTSSAPKKTEAAGKSKLHTHFDKQEDNADGFQVVNPDGRSVTTASTSESNSFRALYKKNKGDVNERSVKQTQRFSNNKKAELFAERTSRKSNILASLDVFDARNVDTTNKAPKDGKVPLKRTHSGDTLGPADRRTGLRRVKSEKESWDVGDSRSASGNRSMDFSASMTMDIKISKPLPKDQSGKSACFDISDHHFDTAGSPF